MPIEIKSGGTISEDYFKNLKYYKKIGDKSILKGSLIYGGEETQKRSEVNVYSRKNILQIFKGITI
jgi:hypothetical protein